MDDPSKQRRVPATGRVRFGCDVLAAAPGDIGRARRVGMLTNDGARCGADAGLSSRVALRQAGIPLVRLFAPEHGLATVDADGQPVDDGRDPLTGLDVYSVYGQHLAPPRHLLEDLDALIVDVPDIGTRFYTYLWSAYHALRACADANIPVVVLDRPNPLGGDLDAVEGPILEPAHASFLGDYPMPIRHSMTLGELMQLWRATRVPSAELHVISCTGWSRAMQWPDTGLPFVPTSPSMPSFESALCYPGTCLFEATNVSVGRGSLGPFQWIGAPWLEATDVAEELNACGLTGVRFAAEAEVPQLPPYAGESLPGVRWTVTDTRAFRPVQAALRALGIVFTRHRRHMAWAPYRTVANPTGLGHFERLVGASGLREVVERGAHDSIDLSRWTRASEWRELVAPHLLYAS